MPVYGNGWERIKGVLTSVLEWLARPFTPTDREDPPEDK